MIYYIFTIIYKTDLQNQLSRISLNKDNSNTNSNLKKQNSINNLISQNSGNLNKGKNQNSSSSINKQESNSRVSAFATPSGTSTTLNYTEEDIYKNFNVIFDKMNKNSYKLDYMMIPCYPQADADLKDLKNI